MLKVMEDYVKENYSKTMKKLVTKGIEPIQKLNELEVELQNIIEQEKWYLLKDIELKYENCIENLKINPEYMKYLLHQNLALIKKEIGDCKTENSPASDEIPENELSQISSISKVDSKIDTEDTVADSFKIPIKVDPIEEAKDLPEEEKNTEGNEFINHEVTPISCNIFNQVYHELTGNSIEMGDECKLTLNLKNKNDLDFFKFCLGHKIPN